ncbi:Pycsar system effector family protein [Sphingopyxis sp. CCNWLW253]
MRREQGSILPLAGLRGIAVAGRQQGQLGMDSADSTTSQGRPAISFPPNAVHLVRTNQQITMQLSQMADQKASILMGATFVVFTLAIGQARSGGGALAMPLAILATFSFLSALLAVSAVLPRVGKAPPVVYKDGKDHSNILFFGRFAQMDEDEFIDAVKARLRTEEDLYETMLRDTYQNGVVLARRKYRYLAHAYRLFVVGLTLTFIAFAVEMAGMWQG